MNPGPISFWTSDCVAMLTASKAPPGILRLVDGETWTRCIVSVEAHCLVAAQADPYGRCNLSYWQFTQPCKRLIAQ
ncbi:hypothetical protein PCA31118_01160 [Pandoraea captiosa]|uniref:Uncharacterized protein n=1 Tax=Pandoraea captiosa TaxID=2508302 RepID=A0A5E4ZPD4_9BURK|nr:hypothetical protein PCA31118_01160 [Pandoraea captiosa]